MEIFHRNHFSRPNWMITESDKLIMIDTNNEMTTPQKWRLYVVLYVVLLEIFCIRIFFKGIQILKIEMFEKDLDQISKWEKNLLKTII